jgi:hypothetical protein
MLNGSQPQGSLQRGLLWFGSKCKELMTSLAASKQPSKPSESIAGTTKQQNAESQSPMQLTATEVRLPVLGQQQPFHNPTEGEVMSTTTTTPNIFGQLAQLLASEALPPVLTLVNNTLTDIETNPQEWINPASATIKGTAFVTALVATLPTIENATVPAAAQFVGALLNTLSAKLTTVSATTTAASIGAAAANTIVNQS